MITIYALLDALVLADWKRVHELVPECLPMVGLAQYPKAGVDVWEHTMLMVAQCPHDRPKLKLACLFHDIGKPKTAKPSPKGGNTFEGHGPVGGEMTCGEQGILRRFIGLSEDDLMHIGSLINLHMDPHQGNVPPPSYPWRDELVDLAELDSASFAGRTLMGVRPRFNELRTKHGMVLNGLTIR